MNPEPEHPLAAVTPGLVHPWPEPPEGGRSILVAPGIRWIRMPLPFALNHINLWLLEDEGGWAIVDTGIGLTDTLELWERVFDAELGGKPVTRVIVTHFHPDHMGNAGWLVERWGVDLWCPQAEWLPAHLAWGQKNDPAVEKRPARYSHPGARGNVIGKFRPRRVTIPRAVCAHPSA